MVDVAVGQFFEEFVAFEMLQIHALLYELALVDVLEQGVCFGELGLFGVDFEVTGTDTFRSRLWRVGYLLRFVDVFDFVLFDFLLTGILVEFLVMMMCIDLLILGAVAAEHAHSEYFFSRDDLIEDFETFPAAFESEQVLLVVGCD